MGSSLEARSRVERLPLRIILKILPNTKNGIRLLTASMMSWTTELACSTKEATDDTFAPSTSIAKPIMTATKMICRGFASVKGVKKLPGTISNTI